VRALIVVDVQVDFLPGGALAVPEGDAVLGPIERLMRSGYELVCATQDWHPAGHASFASAHPGRSAFEHITLDGLPQVLWPDHCVQDTPGADFAPGLRTGPIEAIFRKGTDPRIDSYSGFFDNGQRKDTGLGAWLRGRGVSEIDVVGIALDYCVAATALDAARLGWSTRVIRQACRPVDPSAAAVQAACDRLVAGGVRVA
jgi:nicotinamidase/pyrazinamidase